MPALIARRFLQLPLILFVIYTVTFMLAWMIPGNPLERDRNIPREIEQAMLAQYNLDNPWAFYWDYLENATGVAWLRGANDRPFDLGPSLRHQDWTVNQILRDNLPVSVVLGLLAILLALIIGTFAGIVGAVRRGTLIDHTTLSVALIGVSLPAFVIGTVLLVVFGVWLRWLPIAGWGSPSHILLPAVTLALPPAAYIARLTRFGMIDEMARDYIRTARAKGVGPWRVLLHHALKNAFLPVLSYLGPAAAAAMTGSFVVEKVFAVPGIGAHFVDAVLNKDLTMIMGVVMVYATMLIVFNLIVDIMHAWIDPRIRVA